MQATDEWGNVTEYQYDFTLDTTAPPLTFDLDPASDTSPLGDAQTAASPVILTGTTEANATVTLTETGTTVTADATGQFSFAGINLTVGENSFTIQTLDDAGNSTVTSRIITRTEVSNVDDIVLVEGENFSVSHREELTIPQTSSQLVFTLAALNFDRSDSNAINDAFEVALLDAEGNSLVHTIGSGDAFFNLTEGEEPKLAAGVEYNESASTVTLNLNGVSPGSANLVLRLVNSDRDTTTSVSIRNLNLVESTEQQLPVSSGEDNHHSQPIELAEFGKLTDITPSFPLEYRSTRFDESSNELYAEVAIRNQGNYSIDGPLLVAVSNISDPTVLLRDPDGFTPEGVPYYNFSELAEDGKLDPTEITELGSLTFFNPNRVQFTYELTVLGQLNADPVIESEPPLEAIGGNSYRYEVIAKDANNDGLSYSLLSAPNGMIIDEETGVITWETTVEEIGTHAVVVEVVDSRGGKDVQSFTLSVTETPPNRPPIFTSTPVVDAYINQPYRYDSNAMDPDGDTLSYRLIQGPEDMTVDPVTGEVEWTPPPVMMLGDTVLGRISIPGGRDEFSFSGTAGQRIYIDPLQYGNWQFELYDPNGKQVTNKSAQSIDSGNVFTLTETGNYSIVVNGNQDFTGSYGFTAIDVGMVPVVPLDEVIRGTLSPGTEDDVYRFTGQSGQRLFLDKISNSGSLDWVIYGANDKNLQYSSSFDDIEWKLPYDGEYLLALRGKSPFSSNVNYAFEIITPDEIIAEMELGSLDNPHTVSGEIGEKGERDYYTFTANVGEQFYFDVLDSSFPLSYKIVGPNHQDIQYSSYFSYNDPNRTFVLPESGTYRVEIDGDRESTGTYSFNILSSSKAIELDLSQEYSGRIEPGQETHLYSFSGTKGQRLYLDSLTNTADGKWTIYSPENNSPIASDTTSNSNAAISSFSNGTFLSNDFEVTLPGTGTYLLAIQGTSSNPIDYQFQVLTPPTNVEELAADESGTFSIGGTIAEKGERDIYTFEATQNQWLFLDALSETPSTSMRLVGPSGQNFLNSSIAADYWQAPFILSESGTYQLIVDGDKEAQDPYDFRLVSFTDGVTLPLNRDSITDTLFPASEVMVYQFQGGENERIYIDATATSENNLADLLLYKAGSTSSIASSNRLGDIETVLPGTGTYYLMVRGGNTPTGSVPYSIQAFSYPETSGTPLSLNSSPVNGAISQPGEQDVYTFEVTDANLNQRWLFDLLDGSNIVAKLESPSGNLIFNNLYSSSHNSTFPLTEKGIYRLTLDGNNETTGNYSFSFTPAAPIVPVTRTADSQLTLNAITTVNLGAGSGITTTYSFTGGVGQQLFYDSLSNNYSYAGVTLYSPSGKTEELGTSSPHSDGKVLTLSEEGIYYLEFTNWDSSTTAVNFRLTDIASTTMVGLDTNVSGSFTNPQETDLYRFTVNTPDSWLYFDSAIGSYNNWTLYAPGGRVLNNTNLYYDFELELPGKGEYVLAMKGQGYTPSNYNFQIVSSVKEEPVEFSIGEIIEESIEVKGERDYYKFIGTAGERLVFDALESSGNIRANLVSPTGKQILWNSGISSDYDLPILEETGEYRLEIDDWGEATGDYSFRLVSGDPVVTGLVELDSPISVFVSGERVELINFTGSAGQEVYLKSDYTGTYSNWKVYNLYNNAPLVSGFTGSDREFTLPADGTYTIALFGKGSGTTHQIEIITPEFPTSQMSVGSLVTGTLPEMGSKNTHTFTGEVGQQLLFDSLGGVSGLHVNIYSPSGKSIYNSTNFTVEQKPFTLTEFGTYRVVIDGNHRTVTDSEGYQFRILDVADTTHPNVQNLPFNETIVATLPSAKERQVYQFTGIEGQRLYFDKLEQWNSSNGTGWVLYGTNNESLSNSSWWSPDIELELPNTGTYTLVVGGNTNDEDAESYQFQLVTPPLETTSIELGDTVSTLIGIPGERDTYTFNGTTGQRLFFDSLAGNSQITTQLYSPSGTLISMNNSWGYSSIDSSSPFSLTETGEYRLVIDGNIDATGDYGFRLVDMDAVSTLTIGESIENATLSGKKIDFYRFEAAEGQALYFDLESRWQNANWVLFGPDSKQVQGLSSYDDFEVTPKIEGAYVLAVSGNSDAAIDYSFNAIAPATTETPLTLGTAISGSLTEAGERDEYLFTGLIGQQLFFDGRQGNTDITATLISPSGAQVNTGLSSNYIYGDSKPFTLTESGTYRLVIDGRNETTGEYEFVLSDRAAVTQLPTDSTPVSVQLSPNETQLYRLEGTKGQVLNFDLDAQRLEGASWMLYGPNDRAIATPYSWSPDFQATLPSDGTYTLAIAANSTPQERDYNFSVTSVPQNSVSNTGLNVPISGNLAAGTTNSHRFTAAAGTQIFFDSLKNDSNNWQILMGLVAPDGTNLFQNHSSGNDLEPFTLPLSGEYELQVNGFYPDSSSGNYQFQLVELPSSLRVPGANYLEIGSAVTDTLNPGLGSKVYSFEGVEGLRLLFNTITGTNVKATLYDPEGQSVFSKNYYNSSDLNPYTLTQNGLYHLVVDGNSSSPTNYSFQLLELSDAPELTFNLAESSTLSDGRLGKVYKFSGTEGQTLYFDSLVGNYSNYWKVYGTDSTPLSSNYLNQDFELELPYTGDYTLFIEGSTSPTSVNYEFRVFPHDDETRVQIITPGTGETASNADGSLGNFSVKLLVEDSLGGEDIQDYNIRVWPDPDNANPVITSTPLSRFGLDEKVYRYQLSSIDPDGDSLNYRLLDSPVGALFDNNSNELLWFADKAIPGETVEFSVEVSDGRGGLDIQTFNVETYPSLGKIQGAVFDDLNGNGFRDTKLVKGDNPSIIFAIDVSGSTEAPFVGVTNGVKVETVLDAQIAAVLTMVDSLVAQGYGDRINIGVIPHNDHTFIQDMNPHSPGLQYYTTPNADENGNGIPDIREILESYYPNGHNNFTQTLQTVGELVENLPGDRNVIFMSDGYGPLDEAIAQEVVSNLNEAQVNFNAFGIGLYSTIETIKKIDENATHLTDVEEFVDIFAGWDPRYAIEPLMENVTVYLDLNENGQYDEGEPSRLTKENESLSVLGAIKPHYIFDSLLPGDYTLRVIPPSDRIQTAPLFDAYPVSVTSSGGTFNRLFGLHLEEEQTLNQDPIFLKDAPNVQIEPGKAFVYQASAMDPDADPLTYNLIANPLGMSVNAETGSVVWNPTLKQVETYYAELKEVRDRLAARGREEYAPTTVTFDVVLRVADGNGVQALQTIAIELLPPNQLPVFTSVWSDKQQPQRGKLFEYRLNALDADGDADIRYELVNPPTGVTLNPDTGILRWTPSQTGEFQFTVKAIDSLGGEASQTITATVVEPRPNTPPEITATPRSSVRIGSTYLYQLPLTDSDGDPLTFNFLQSPTGMELDAEGRIVWTPTPNQFGSHPISLEVSDGEDTTTLSWTLNVSNQTVNRAPSITSTPNLITNLERVYQYQLEGFDPDGDLLLWTLDKAPSGMVIDPNSGMLSWQPNATQLGEHTIAIRVTDATGYFVGQEFDLTVRGINTPPEIVSVPLTTAAVGQEYRYQIASTDIENDGGRYSLGIAPKGMQIDPQTGLITWTPTAQQSGSVDVEVLVSDTQGSTNRQTYTIEVGSDAINHPPVITSTAKYFAATGVPYRYQIEATDADNDALIYQPISVPNGMTLDVNTGELRWDSPTFGTHQVVVGVNDGRLGAAQGFTLTVQNDLPPVFNTNEPPTVAIPNRLFSYDIQATDPNGTPLTYRLDDASTALGMTVDELGRLRWTPTVENVGTHPITIEVTDELGTTATQTFNLTVSSDTISPVVEVLPSGVFIVDGDFEVPLGTPITFFTNATDNIGVTGVQLFLDEVPVTLTANGTASYTPSELGTLTAKAVAVDAAGNLGESSIEIRVYDPNDLNPPIVELSPTLGEEPLTDFTDIIGTVTDDNLTNYVLSIAPASGGEFVEIASGDSQITNGKLAEFDPTLLQNDTYILRLTATDESGNSASTEQMVDVAGELKLGNFRLSFTDLEVPVAGIPINLTRTYDTLTTNQSDDFGYGWRLEFRDTDLRTSVGRDELYEQMGIPSVGFEEGTRVYVTLPGGKRTGFTFKPVMDPEIIKALRMGAPLPQSMIFYNPAFETDDGEQVTLSAQKTQLLYNQETGQYYHPSGSPYNPANSFFGGSYTLTTKEGIEYVIDGTTGDLLTVTDTNGNTLTYSDEGIFSSTGKSVTFERNAEGRIVTAVDPEGERIEYEYDENGDLVGVTDREENTTRFEYHEEREHYLEEIIDPLGRTGVRTEYDESGRLKRMLDVNGEAVEFVYDPDRSIQEVRDANGYPTFYQYDDRGNVVQVTNALGHSTYLEYDDRNNLIQLEDANGLITKYSYDANGNITSRTESYCGCPSVVPGTTKYTYNQYGQTTSLVLSTGASLHMEYDNFGNMLSMKDGKGNLIQSFTYYSNGLVKSETDTTGTTTYEYDQFGNPIKTIDSNGGVITMEYNANGLLDKMVEDNGTPLDLSDDEISTFTYDKEGRQLRADYGNGIWVEYGYEGAGQDWTVLEAPTIGRIERKFTDDGKLAGWVTPDGGTPSFYYDEAGRLWRETDTSGNVITEYGYDPAGRLSSIKDVRTGATTLRKYDAGNRLIEEIAPLGSYTKSIYDPTNGKLVATERGQYLTDENTGELIVDSTTHEYVVDPNVTPQIWSYEYEGTRTTVTDPLGRKTTSVQDEYYLPTETIYQQRDGRDYRTSTSYLYDNNLQEAKDYPARIVDIAGRDRLFTYDELGRLQTATDLGNEIYTYSYGQNGLDLIQSPLSITTSGEVRETLAYGYDDLGNLNRVTYGDGSSKLMSYRPTDNRLGTVTLPSGETIQYEYDEAGRVQSETTKTVDGTIASTVSYSYENGNIATVTDSTGTTTYSYDPLTGSLSGIDYPNGSSIAYTYDLLGRVKTVAEKTSATGTEYVTQYGYDAFGNLETVQDPSGQITRMKYDVMNRLQERHLPNGVTTVYEYDELDRVESIVHTNAEGEVVASVSYERSGIGEPTKITREDGSYVMLEYDEALRVKKESFYDAEGVLVDETSITYDAAGKRIVESSLNGGDRTFSYTAGYQLDRVESGEQTEDYDYDENGRLTSIYRSGEVLNLEHDASDRLTKVENQTTGETIEYTYDGSGRRVAVTQDNEVRQFLVAPSMGSGLESTDLITDVHGNLISNYIYAGGASPFMRLDGNGNPIYYLTDAMGTAIGLVDGDGIEVGDLRYDSFGNLRSASGVGVGATGGDFGFQGQWLESETGLYHFRARDYDPKTGLFLSRDPVDIIEMEPESANPYQFVYNNPFVYSDPTGMFTLTELNVSQTLQTRLAQLKTYAGAEAKEQIAARANQMVADAFFDAIGHFLPLDSNTSSLTSLVNDGINIVGRDYGGVVFERFFKGLICRTFPESISNYIYFEPTLKLSGFARDSGYQCPQTSFTGIPYSGTSRPDFIITSGRPRRHRTDGIRSWLIGDIKLSLRTAVSDYVGLTSGDSPNKPEQWGAIHKYARKNGTFTAGIITLFDGG